MLDYLLPGVLIGLSSGIAPGPLMTLVVSQTLRYGFREGAKVAIAPFLTDIPIIVVIMVTLSLFKNIDLFLGIIAFLGASYLLFLAYESFKIKGFEIDSQDVKPQSIRKGFLTNLLNPSPYLFYFTVGGAFILKSFNTNAFYSLLFIGGFLSSMVVTKILLAYIVGRSRNFFKSKAYKVLNWVLGLLLVFYAIKFIQEGFDFIF